MTFYLSLSTRHMLIGKQKSFCGIDSLSVQFNNMCSCMLIDCNLFANTRAHKDELLLLNSVKPTFSISNQSFAGEYYSSETRNSVPVKAKATFFSSVKEWYDNHREEKGVIIGSAVRTGEGWVLDHWFCAQQPGPAGPADRLRCLSDVFFSNWGLYDLHEVISILCIRTHMFKTTADILASANPAMW